MLDENLVSDFVTEGREHLDAIEPDLLAMESGGGISSETINSVFRAIHSIKGGAGFLAFDALKKLSHSMENVLMALRDGKLTLTPGITDVLLRGVDKLRAMLDDIQASDGVPFEDELFALEAIMGEGTPKPRAALPEAPAGAQAPAFDDELLVSMKLTLERVREAHSPARFLYVVHVVPNEDLVPRGMDVRAFLSNIDPLGEYVGCAGELAALRKPEAQSSIAPFALLFSSVLEPDLVNMALELPDARVRLVSNEMLGVGELSDLAPVPPDHMGQIFIDHFRIDAKDVLTAARLQGQGDKRQLGAILLESGLISAEMIVRALQIQEEMRGLKAKSPASARPGRETQAPATPASQAPETLRVRVDVLSRLMSNAGELVLARNQLLRALESSRGQRDGLDEILQNIDHVTTELQEGVMQTRIQPIAGTFSRFSRVVRDTARQLGKDIVLNLHGTEVELDKSILESLSDPLTHLVRNSADHGIESPEERRAAGKSPQGRINLSAWHEGGQVNITIADDGGGMDPKKIVAKAIEKGVITQAEAAKLSAREMLELIFAPGFSTADVVSDLSGRGVGMDVVRTNIVKLGGIVSIESSVGKGTTILLQLPLTLAIIPSIIVGVGDERFALPQVNIEEFVWVRASEVNERIERFHDNDVLRLRERLLPLVSLSQLLGIPSKYPDPDSGELRRDKRRHGADRRLKIKQAAGQESSAKHPVMPRGRDRRSDWHGDYNVVVLRVGKNRFGLIVDRLFDTEEIVVKPLSSYYKKCQAFSGATILGDGQVVLILDAHGIMLGSNLHFADIAAEDQRRLEEEERQRTEAGQRERAVLMLRGGGEELLAFPQSSVLRLERIAPADIKEMGDREFIDYRGGVLPLLRLDRVLPLKPLDAGADELFLVIPKVGARSADAPAAGILVAEIVDACNVAVHLDGRSLHGPGIEGAAMINEHMTLFLDPRAVLEAACYIGEEAS